MTNIFSKIKKKKKKIIGYGSTAKSVTVLNYCDINDNTIDFFIDIRKDSKNFGKCYFLKLSNYGDGVYIPSGFLHGFCTLEDNTKIGYKVDEFYNSKNEVGLIWNDPIVDIQWPFDYPPIISEKDSKLFTWDYFLKEMGYD